MPYIVGLTGGIGSGKSTVLEMLAARGAIVIDADVIVHELQRAGEPVFDAMVEEFGAEIVGDDGELDRPRVAEIAFADPAKTKRLNEIVHPAVGKVVLSKLASAGENDVVVIDIPLLTETTRAERGLQKVIVVDVAPKTQFERAVARGSNPDDVRARMKAQATRADRLMLADVVLDNEESLEALEKQVDELWAELRREAASS